MKFEQIPENNNEEKVDPTTFSPLSSSIKFNEEIGKRGKSVTDENSGTEYFFVGEEKHIRESEIEMFVSLLSKGILHVSDVIEKDGKLYSKKMPLESVEPGKEMEKEAENFMLLYLFSDWDHRVLTKDKIEDQKSNNVIQHRNLFEDEKGSFVHYDYGAALRPIGAGSLSFKKDDNELVNQMSIKKIKSEVYQNETSLLDSIKRTFSGKTKQLLKVLLEKVELFEERVTDTNFFNAVVAKSNLDTNTGRFNFLNGETPSEKEESLRKYFLERLEILKRVIKND